MKQPKTLPIKSAAPIGIGFGDLLGCPFCGTKPVVREYKQGAVWIECPNWEACGDVSTPIFRSLELAAAQWNRRQPNASNSATGDRGASPAQADGKA